ncbi:hypothetical protein D3C77_406070 [compost metagenome]
MIPKVTLLLKGRDLINFVTDKPIYFSLSTLTQQISVIGEISKPIIPITQALQTSSVLPKARQIRFHALLYPAQNVR